MSIFERFFKLKENQTNMKTEVLAGFTTFFTMAYILIVNPMILSNAGMDKGALFTATAISAGIATLVMAFLTNYPLALAPGMGLNAFFAFGVVLGMGYSWQTALTAVFIEGIIFIILSFFNVREAIINAIPTNLKYAVSVGIGLFIAFIGFSNAGIVVSNEATKVALGDVTQTTVILSIIGIVITALLVVKKVKGSLLIGMLFTYGLGVIFKEASLPTSIISAPPSLEPIFFQLEFDKIFTWELVPVVLAFLFVDIFDTVGTLIGVSSKMGLIDSKGKIPKAKQALLADSIGTVAGSILGTSTVTTYVESASGVSEGGKTGMTSFTVGILFFLSLIFSPILLLIPSYATAPVLIIVGLFMLSPIKQIDLDDYTEALPAFLTILLMPLTYSIADGLLFGIISYVLIKLLSGKGKDASILMYILAIFLIIKFFL